MMQPRTIEITITAGVGVGKSTLANMLAEFLNQNGFLVTVSDIDIDALKNSNDDSHEEWLAWADARLKAMVAAKTEIAIKTVQKTRNPLTVR